MFIRSFSRMISITLFGLLFFLFFSSKQAFSQKAVQFESTGDYIEVPHSVSLAPSQLTIELWLKVYEASEHYQTILDKQGDESGYYLYLKNQQFPLRFTAMLKPKQIGTPNLIDTSTWYHLAVTQGADSLRIYMDGQYLWSKENVYSANTDSSLRIGECLGFPDDTLSFKGEIDDLRIWNYARSQAEIASAMHEKLTGSESGLAAYWDFDSQTESTISDLTPNGNDGIVHGNAWLIDSDAPIGFVPPSTPVGLRTYGGDGAIDLAWKPGDSSVVAYALYRSDSSSFVTDSSTLIATIQAPASTYTDAAVTAGQIYYYRLRAIDHQNYHSRAGKAAMGHVHAVQDDYMTGVYYYIWYRSTEWEPEEGLDRSGYLRYYLQPQQPPMLGLYSSRNPHVIRQHLNWMQTYGIDFIVIDWGEFDVITVRDYILPILAGSNIKFAIFHGANRYKDSGLINVDSEIEEILVSEFILMADTFFNYPNHLTIEGRPVVFFYTSQDLRGNYVQAFDRIRSEMQARGFNLYLVGDEGNFYEINSEHMQFVDAVSPYIMLGYEEYPIDSDYFGDLTVQGGYVDSITTSAGIPLIPNVNPGTNGRHLVPPNIWPRQSTAGASCTSTLEEYIKLMRPFVDPELNMIMITSWNEWWEDTQIEPTIVTPPTTIDINGGTYYTGGYSYEGYGFKALEAVRDLLAPGLVTPVLDHFTYTANTDSTYSISISEALLGGTSLEAGDEIGVFDGNLCVGAVAVTGDWPRGFWAWIDRSATEATDGFIPGNPMIFRIWDASSKQTFTAAATFATADSTFGSGAYAQVSMQSQVVLIEPDSTIQVILATDSSTVSLAFTSGGGITIAFTGGAVAGDTVSVTQMQTAPQELPTTATFDHPLYYLNIETTASDYNAILCFGYTESLLQAKGVLESDLGAVIWEEDTMRWKSLPVTIDTAENTVTVSTDHISLWALVSTTEELITRIQEEGLPDKFALEQNYPNPFNPITTIQYKLPQQSNVQITIYDLLGRKVTTLISETQDAGYKSIQWNATNNVGQPVSTGMYFYAIETGKYSAIRKMILLK